MSVCNPTEANVERGLNPLLLTPLINRGDYMSLCQSKHTDLGSAVLLDPFCALTNADNNLWLAVTFSCYLN